MFFFFFVLFIFLLAHSDFPLNGLYCVVWAEVCYYSTGVLGVYVLFVPARFQTLLYLCRLSELYLLPQMPLQTIMHSVVVNP